MSQEQKPRFTSLLTLSEAIGSGEVAEAYCTFDKEFVAVTTVQSDEPSESGELLYERNDETDVLREALSALGIRVRGADDPHPLPASATSRQHSDDEALPETLDELCAYIEQYADDIYVRDQIDGRWGSFALTELPQARAVHWVLRFVREGRVPLRVRSDP